MLALVNVLKKTKELLTPAGRWTQFGYAKDATGRTVSLQAASAVCFCLVGALQKSGSTPLEPRLDAQLFFELNKTIGKDSLSIPSWNDARGRTQEEVLQLLENTISRLEA
jgi:hypothetical protein